MRTLRPLTILLCLAAAVLALLACGGSGDGTETIAPLTDSTTAADQPAQGGGGGSKGSGSGGGGEEQGVPDSSKLSAELDALGERIGSQVGATIGAPGAPPYVLGSLQSGSAWSTIKVPIALQVIDEAGGVDELTSAQRADITAAITQSDNEAAARLFDILVSNHGSVEAASQALTDLLREAGDEETVVSTEPRGEYSSYGQTEWSLQAQQTFMGALLNGCIGDAGGRDFVLTKMSEVVVESWGLAAAGVPALWKGGWGPGVEDGYLVRQMGKINVDGTDYAVTIAAIADDGSFEGGQAATTEVAKWLVDHAPKDAGEPGGC